MSPYKNDNNDDDPHDTSKQGGDQHQHHHQQHHHHHGEGGGDHHHDDHGDDDGAMPLYVAPKQRQRWGEKQHSVHNNWGDLFFDLFFVALACKFLFFNIPLHGDFVHRY